MTTSIRILTTTSLDSSPSILLASADGSKTLINCGEGCQRSFLDTTNTGSSGFRLRSVNRVCLTHIAHDAIGGLPGMVLTTADASEASLVSRKISSSNNKRRNNNGTNSDQVLVKDESSTTSGSKESTGNLDIVGPKGTKSFLKSLRHFMRRDRFELNVHESTFNEKLLPNKNQNSNIKNKKKKKKKNNSNENEFEGFYVQTIPLLHTVGNDISSGDSTHVLNEPEKKRCRTVEQDDPTRTSSTSQVEILSFVFTTPPIPGKFLPDKARELGIPPGPLFGQLKSGKSITFIDKATGSEKTVESSEVVNTGSPGVALVVIYCPSMHVLHQLQQSEVIQQVREGGKNEPDLEVMIHVAPQNIIYNTEYLSWMQSFGRSVDHIIVQSLDSIGSCQDIQGLKETKSPFHSAALGALTRSLLHEDLFPPPVCAKSEATNDASAESQNTGLVDSVDDNSDLNILHGKPMMEYVLIPRAKKGLSEATVQPTVPFGISEDEKMEIQHEAESCGAIDLAKELLQESKRFSQSRSHSLGEVIFTGTGSALPCKHRNVTGMYLRMKNGKAMLLDVGEGTTGQLLRAKQHSDTDFVQLICDIKAVFISHPHADHHVGLLRFLTERHTICGQSDPVILMAPSNLFRFLDEFSSIDPRIRNSYICVDCRDMEVGKENPAGEMLKQYLGVTYCASIQVAHCYNSFAIVIDGTSFGRVSYSGDCRPSSQFAAAGIDSDLLIHEATFEDGMEDEATIKKHCTVGEALGIGGKMKAKAIVLTHFSQRYPRIPPLTRTPLENCKENGTSSTVNGTSNATTENNVVPVVFAFDFMTLTLENLVDASKLTPALRLLYPDEEDKNIKNSDGGMDADDIGTQTSATELLSVPGLFAQKGVL